MLLPSATARLTTGLAHAALGLTLLASASHALPRATEPDGSAPAASASAWRRVWQPFVSEKEAAALRQRRRRMRCDGEDEAEAGVEAGTDGEAGFVRQGRRNAGLLVISFFETGSAAFQLGRALGQAQPSGVLVEATLAWLFVAVSIIHRPPQTPAYLLLILVHLLAALALFRLLDTLPSLARGARPSAGPVADVLLAAAFIVLSLRTPMSPGGVEAVVPRAERERLVQSDNAARNDEDEDEDDDPARAYARCPTSPEDYASLWGIVSYRWMNAIQLLALRRPLRPTDVWRLRDINDVRLLYARYAALPGGLLARILATNANDIALDALYKVVGVSLAYAGPAVMKQILDAIALSDEAQGQAAGSGIDDWTPRQQAFVWAIVGLILTIVRFMSELQNFHHARQVGLRIRITVVQELFDKALKRRDVSIAPDAFLQQDPVATSADAHATAEGAEVHDTAGLEGADLTRAAERQADRETRVLDCVQEGGNGLPSADGRDGAKVDDANKVASDRGKAGSEDRADIGRLINLMSSAVNDLLRMGCDLHQLYGAPAEVIIATTFLYSILGWPALAGFAILLLALPLNYILGQRNLRLQRRYAADRDKRLGMMSELLGAVKFLKLQAMEGVWRGKVVEARDEELRRLLACKINSFLFELLWSAIPIMVTLLAFFLYTSVLQKELTVSVAFTSITLFYMLRAPLGVIPTFLTLGLQALVSIRRLETFLAEAEVDAEISSLKHPDAPATAFGPATAAQADIHRLRLDHASFSYGHHKFGLHDVSVEFKVGLNVICGPNGAGKSTLLSAILGEVPRTAGSVQLLKFIQRHSDVTDEDGGDSTRMPLSSNVSFASQNAWLQDGVSVRSNILFTTPFDRARYDATLTACALRDDLARMPFGDATRISGATVSGGQRARIALARALYARAEVVLLDDVLAAVDVGVQAHLVEHALGGGGQGAAESPLLRGRTIVLATHHVASVLPFAAWVMLLRQGRVAAQGTAAEMRDKIHSVVMVNRPSASSASDSNGSNTTSGGLADKADESRTGPAEVANELSEAKGEAILLFEKEARATGRVQLRTVLFYVAACSGMVWAAIVLLTVAFRLMTVGEQFWLKTWGEAGQRTHSAHGQGYYLTIYALIGVSIILLNAVRVALFFWTSFRASRVIFEQTFSALLATSLRWFERRSAGQIQNRFSTDQNVADVELPQTLMNTINNAFGLLSFLLICGYIVPWFLVPCAIGILLGPFMVRGFIAATRDLQRIEATSMTPLYAVFGEAVRGLITIRAFGAEKLYIDRLTSTLEVVSAQWWCICSIEVWLSFRFQILGGIAVFIVSTLGLLSAVPSGSAGMLIASSQLLTQAIYFLLNDIKNLNRNLASVERLAEYARLRPEEEDVAAISEGRKPARRKRAPAAWPSMDASIVIEDLNVRYLKHSPLVLQDISVTINPREKIAIVGKTGSGKSTLISCLLGAVVPESGRIFIDGLDIAQLSLHDLRSRCTLVPQDPVILSGTIRSNLDPLSEHTDAELLHIMQQIQPDFFSAKAAATSSTARQKPASRSTATAAAAIMLLDSPVAAGGVNFSAGQAQIISLARALLRHSPIVILDEATSSASAEADALIQRMVRQNTTSTFITVAHRLSTVMDYDRIIVMHAGRIVEVGPPAELAARPGGVFAGMVHR